MTKACHVVACLSVILPMAVWGAPAAKAGPLAACSTEKLHNNEEIVECMLAITAQCPDISKLDHIGTSTAGNDIFALKFSTDLTDYPIDHVNYRRRTSIGLLANMHGNEATGRELLFWVMTHICKNRAATDKLVVQHLLQNTDIWILPTINPDGFNERYKSAAIYRDNSSQGQSNMSKEDLDNFAKYWVTGRYIKDKSDMNRNFPAFNGEIYGNATSEEELRNNLAASQLFNRTFIENLEKYMMKDLEKETRLIIDFLDKTPMDFAINFHDGAQVVNYPFDAGISGKHVYTPTPDDTLYIDTSKGRMLIIWIKVA